MIVRDYAESVRAQAILGDHREILLEMALDLEEEILSIGSRHFTQEQLDEAAAQIENFADRHPLSDRFGFESTHVEVSEGGAIAALLSVPIAPMRGLEGAGNTSDAIMRVAALGRTVGHIVRYLPVNVRWQLELLLIELQSLDLVQQAGSDFTRLSASIERASKTAETMPADVRKEIEVGLTSLERSQEGIQTTLRAASETLGDLDQSLAQAQDVLGGVKAATVDLAKAGAAWERTAKATKELVDTVVAIRPSDDKAGDGDEVGFDIGDYERTSSEIHAVVVQLRGLLADT